MKKAVALAARSADNPKAASVICTTIPADAPNMAAKPIARPPVTVRDKNNIISGPGVMASTKLASEKPKIVPSEGIKSKVMESKVMIEPIEKDA